ncbi:ATP-dependent helicase HrpB [Arthrospiribacter ruber]|uniref:ATP-dependent helicase HrpB n=1 Tax=Arthrospiribacter ruber TaxID=2487934 RepID=UPI001FE9D6BD|nr:ATP-dependent helicase HrpB [Arthrospiribacter ruber]
MKINYSQFNLPVSDILDKVKLTCQNQNTLIVTAPPGAGKSTLLPLALLEEDFLQGKKILMLEPRRLAAKSIALRMSEMLGEKVGETVGYRIRFEHKVSSNTRLEVLTEGILTRMLHQDNALEGVGLVIFDEFHERNIHADLAMALCRESQLILRPDLRILVMSATLDMPSLAELLQAPVLVSEGRIYPVEIKYTGDFDIYSLPESVSQVILKAASENEGDILVFLPGQGEIKKTEALLKNKLRNFAIHPLFGQLSPTAQFQAIMPRKDGKRKVVLATSIAETSLTIEGIKVVVDCGFGKRSKFNPRSGLSRLETVAISKDSADQRAGRAGRLGPGLCYRMWSRATHDRLEEFRVPEIQEADLAPLVLDLAHWGVDKIENLTWLSPPPSGSLAQAYELLEQLDATQNGKLTAHGKSIHKIPAHPRIAHMLFKAKELGLVSLASDIAALLEERDPLNPEMGVDINLRIEALRRARKEGLSIKGIRKLEKIASQYRKILVNEPEYNGPVDPFESGLLIAYAYPERIASARPGNNAQFQLANGKLAMMGHRDDLAHESWLAISHIDERDGMGKIFMASPINPSDLKPLLKEKKVVRWDKQKEEFLAHKVLGIGSIVLRSSPISDINQSEKVNAIIPIIRNDLQRYLAWNENVTQLINRIELINKTHDNLLPKVNEDWIKIHLENWLGPYLSNVKSKDDLKKLEIDSILKNSLSFEQQKLLEEYTPLKIMVPSGSQIKIDYREDAQPPILSVRLQEVFGWMETPSINQGKTRLLLHLLSPGFKPVQVTSDLRSFWSNTYFEVKKDLKRRYPKHSWPEDPFQAEAVRGVRKRN